MRKACERFGISPRTGYKWLSRFLAEGVEGLVDRSSAPRGSYQTTRPEVVEAVVATRKRFPYWGPKKLKAWLEREHPSRQWPAASTIGELLKRQGLVKFRRRRNRVPSDLNPLTEGQRPNELWCADFKGHFRVGNCYCYPLTVTDSYSRYLLRCQSLNSVKGHLCRPVFEAAFKEFGLPNRIRTDNGTPFATNTAAGLSKLSIWWTKLGIVHERIDPGQPQQNGRHERMHRTLKAQVTRPPKRSRAAQQRSFNQFRQEFNELRPHEALGQTPPAEHYERSARPYRPEEDPDYPSHFEVRLVGPRGNSKFRNLTVQVGRPLSGEFIGIEQIGEGRWTVWFGPVLLGSILEGKRNHLEFLAHTISGSRRRRRD